MKIGMPFTITKRVIRSSSIREAGVSFAATVTQPAPSPLSPQKLAKQNQALVESLYNSPQVNARKQAAQLATFTSRAMRQTIWLALIQDQSETVVHQLAQVIGDLKPDKAYMRAYANRRDTEERAVDKLKSALIKSVLVGRLGNPVIENGVEAAGFAARAVQSVLHDDAKYALIRGLVSDLSGSVHEKHLEWVVYAISTIKNASLRDDAVDRFLNHPSNMARRGAARCLPFVTDPDLIERGIQQLSIERDPFFRKMALLTLPKHPDRTEKMLVFRQLAKDPWHAPIRDLAKEVEPFLNRPQSYPARRLLESVVQ